MTREKGYLLLGLALALAVCVAVVLAPWVLVLGGAPLSGDPAAWAQFGDYVGGTLATLISALALLALLLTVRQQNAQIATLRERAAKEDLLRTLERLERDFERALDGTALNIDNLSLQFRLTALQVLYTHAHPNPPTLIPAVSEIEAMTHNDTGIPVGTPQFLLFETYVRACFELVQLRRYIDELQRLEAISGTNVSSRYYIDKYRLPYLRLKARGYPLDDWPAAANAARDEPVPVPSTTTNNP